MEKLKAWLLIIFILVLFLSPIWMSDNPLETYWCIFKIPIICSLIIFLFIGLAASAENDHRYFKHQSLWGELWEKFKGRNKQ